MVTDTAEAVAKTEVSGPNIYQGELFAARQRWIVYHP